MTTRTDEHDRTIPGEAPDTPRCPGPRLYMRRTPGLKGEKGPWARCRRRKCCPAARGRVPVVFFFPVLGEMVFLLRSRAGLPEARKQKQREAAGLAGPEDPGTGAQEVQQLPNRVLMTTGLNQHNGAFPVAGGHRIQTLDDPLVREVPRRRRPPRLRLPATAFASAPTIGCAGEAPAQEAEEDGTVTRAAFRNETITMQNEVTGVLGPDLFTVGGDDTPIVGVDPPPRTSRAGRRSGSPAGSGRSS